MFIGKLKDFFEIVSVHNVPLLNPVWVRSPKTMGTLLKPET